MKSLQVHEFALYYPSIQSLIKNPFEVKIYEITDRDLVYRIASILRLKTGTNIILFNENYHVESKIIEITKNQVKFIIKDINKNKAIEPIIAYGLPVLKKEAFEESLYALVELGVQEIYPLVTQKIHRMWLSKDNVRLKKIIIAAAEQAKQFSVPILYEPQALTTWLKTLNNTHKIFFDCQGTKTWDAICELKKQEIKKIVLLSGPEADLNQEEKKLIYNNNFISCALTPTILRAKQAVTVGAGLIRSLL